MYIVTTVMIIVIYGAVTILEAGTRLTSFHQIESDLGQTCLALSGLDLDDVSPLDGINCT